MQGRFIGSASRETGLSVDTIRFYEKVGVINRPPRTRGKFRIFSSGDIQDLRVIAKLTRFGFSLNEVKLVFGLQHKNMDAGAKVRELLQRKLGRVRAKIRLLRRFEEQLRQDLRRRRITQKRLPEQIR